MIPKLNASLLFKSCFGSIYRSFSIALSSYFTFWYRRYGSCASILLSYYGSIFSSSSKYLFCESGIFNILLLFLDEKSFWSNTFASSKLRKLIISNSSSETFSYTILSSIFFCKIFNTEIIFLFYWFNLLTFRNFSVISKISLYLCCILIQSL